MVGWGGFEPPEAAMNPAHPVRSFDEWKIRDVPPVGGLVRRRQTDGHELPIEGSIGLADAMVMNACSVEATGERSELILVCTRQGNGVGPVRELARR